MKETMDEYKVTLPDLPYDYSALEPAISGKIMELHHSAHHAAYVNNFNKLSEQAGEAWMSGDLKTALALQSGLNFNGGGHLNHTIFWENLAPQSAGGGQPPTGPLAEQIDHQWGSLNNFVSDFSAKTAAIQGSGWGWLGYSKKLDRLVIMTCANQDPLSSKGLDPLLGVDVWEHAYYLQYNGARPKYLEAIWGVINWANVAERYAEAKS